MNRSTAPDLPSHIYSLVLMRVIYIFYLNIFFRVVFNTFRYMSISAGFNLGIHVLFHNRK